MTLYRYEIDYVNSLGTFLQSEDTETRESKVPAVTGIATAAKHGLKCVIDQMLMASSYITQNDNESLKCACGDQ